MCVSVVLYFCRTLSSAVAVISQRQLFFLVKGESFMKTLAELLAVLANVLFLFVLRKIQTSRKVAAKPVVAPKKQTIV